MGLPEKVALRMARLPVERQRQVLAFVELLAEQPVGVERLHNAADAVDWTDGDFVRLSETMWHSEAEAVSYTQSDCREPV